MNAHTSSASWPTTLNRGTKWPSFPRSAKQHSAKSRSVKPHSAKSRSVKPHSARRRSSFSNLTAPRLALLALIPLLALIQGCGSDDSSGSGAEGQVLRIAAIPDEEPELVQRRNDLLVDYLSEQLDDVSEVEFVPVTSYEAAVTGFKVGDLDLVWFGGLTGVQARLEVEGAEAIAQRDIDAKFRSVFIANANADLAPIDDVAGLTALKGKRFTFGSESSTSGRLMPQSFLSEAGVSIDDFDGQPGFSGSHDATIEVVQAGTFEVGALNSQVWDERVDSGEVEEDQVGEVFRTPEYFDYHWLAHPSLEGRFGSDFVDAVTDALLSLDIDTPEGEAILELFGAEKFIATSSENYSTIEEIGREAGLIVN